MKHTKRKICWSLLAIATLTSGSVSFGQPPSPDVAATSEPVVQTPAQVSPAQWPERWGYMPPSRAAGPNWRLRPRR